MSFFLMGESISGTCSIAMFDYQQVNVLKLWTSPEF